MEQTTIELAVQALQAEKAKVDGAIAELRASLNGQGITLKASGGEGPAPSLAPPKSGGRSGMTAAGRKALSLAAKRRWAKARAAGKSRL